MFTESRIAQSRLTAPAVFIHDRSRNSKRRESSRQRRSENSSNISLTRASLCVYMLKPVVHTSSVCTSVCCSRGSLGSPLPNMEMVSAFAIEVTIKAITCLFLISLFYPCQQQRKLQHVRSLFHITVIVCTYFLLNFPAFVSLL